MAERVVIPADAAKVGWRTNGASPNASTEPNASKRADGWPFEAPWPHDEANWQMNLSGALHLWLQGFIAREFEGITGGIGATTEPGRFWVTHGPGGNRYPGLTAFSLTPATFTAITGACTDGEQCYYLDTSTAIYAANPETGAQIWAVTPANITAGAIAAEGRQVYVVGDAGNPGMVHINRVTGATVGRSVTAGVTAAAAICANGVRAVAACGNNAECFNVQASVPVYLGAIAHGAAIYAADCDSANVYIGGVQSGGIDVRCNVIATQAAVWTATLPTVAAAQVNAIKTDGEFVYVGTQTAALTAGGTANLFILQASDGALVAAYMVQTAASVSNCTHLAIDGRGLIFVTLDGVIGSVISCRVSDAFLAISGLFPNITIGWDSDGVGLVADDGAGKAERYLFHDRPVLFQRANGSDNNRRPFQKLALPISR
jgi:hypothetical protein